MKVKSSLAIILIGLWCLPINAQSYKQDRRFKAALMFGTTLSQIDGDKHSGYDKGGLQTGLRGITILTDELELSFELLFTQKGSKSQNVSITSQRLGSRKPLNMRLNYMEVPILLNYRFEKLDKNFYKWELHGGLSYARLLNYKIEESRGNAINKIIFSELAEEFVQNDISIILGGKLNFSPHFGIALRHSLSLNKFYDNPEAEDFDIEFLRNYFFSLLAIYSF